MENEINYPYIHEFLSEMYQQENPLLLKMEETAEKEHIPILHRESARFLEILCTLAKPRRILEIGTAIGYSSIILAGTLVSEGVIDTIERDEEMAEKAAWFIQRAGLGKVIRIIQGEALKVLPCLNTPYDLIFLDAAKGQYPDFFPHCLRLLKAGGVLLSDNVLYKGRVAKPEFVEHKHRTITVRLREYLNALCHTESLVTSILPIGDGITVSYKKE